MKRFVSVVLALVLLATTVSALAVTINDDTLPDSSKCMYVAKTTLKFNMRKEADEKGYKVREVPKGADVMIIEYGDEWCLIEYKNKTGYAKTKWLFMLRTSDPYKYPNVGYDKPYGIGVMKTPFNTKGLAGTKNNYLGNQLDPGQKITVHTYNEQTDVATILVWKSLIELPAGAVEVTPIVPYEDAQPGDLIAAYTTYQSQQYAFPYNIKRQHNIGVALERLQKTVIKSGGLFSFLEITGPYNKKNGYEISYITGGAGKGYGGGVCQISTLTRSAVLGIPVMMKEWSMHTDEGALYTTQICDATVGRRDFSFYNCLDYPILLDYNNEMEHNVMNLFIYRAE